MVWTADDGEQLQLGETMLQREPWVVPAGPARICVHAPGFVPHCRAIEPAAGELLQIEVWLAELQPRPATVSLPARVVSVQRRVDGVREASAVAVDGAVTVPARHDVWLEMVDAGGHRCLCHLPAPEPGEDYSCWWPCGDSSGR